MSHRRPTIQGWLTQPTTQGIASEGHTSAVNVLRMVGTSHQHHPAELVPFRSQPAPLRSIKPPRAAEHDAPPNQPQGCTAQTPTESRSLLGWLAAIVVFGLLAGAMALMGTPHDH